MSRRQKKYYLGSANCKVINTPGHGPLDQQTANCIGNRSSWWRMYMYGSQRSDVVRALVIAVVVALVPLPVVDAVAEDADRFDVGGRIQVRALHVEKVDLHIYALFAFHDLAGVRGAHAAHHLQVIARRLVANLAVPLGAKRDATGKGMIRNRREPLFGHGTRTTRTSTTCRRTSCRCPASLWVWPSWRRL